MLEKWLKLVVYENYLKYISKVTQRDFRNGFIFFKHWPNCGPIGGGKIVELSGLGSLLIHPGILVTLCFCTGLYTAAGRRGLFTR